MSSIWIAARAMSSSLLDEEDEYTNLLTADAASDGSGSGGGGAGGEDDVVALKAQLAAQQQLLSDVLAGRATATPAPQTAMLGFGHVPSPTSDQTQGGGGGGGSSSGEAGEGASAPKMDDAALAAMLSSQDGANPLLSADADAQLARDMQQMEMMLAAQDSGSQDPPEPPALEDPVWGKFVAPEEGHKPHQVLCISMCPCCIGPYCSTERKGIYKKVVLTASFILSAIQLALVVGSLFFRGFAPTTVNPMLGPWPDTLDLMGAKNAAKIVYRYEVWRFFTPMMLHAGFVHLATNLVMQLRLAIFLEVQWGLKRFLFIYFFAGLFSAVYSTVFIPASIGVGASGALMGILGAWFVDLLASWSEGDAQARSQRSMQLIMAFVNMLVILGFSAVPMIDWAAHAFGMLGGMLICMYAVHDKHEGKWRYFLKFGGGGGFVFGLIGAIVYIFTVMKPDRQLLEICHALQDSYPKLHC